MNIIRLLSALLFFFQQMNKHIQKEKKEGDERMLKEKIEDDKKLITSAFKNEDPKLLNEVFNQ